MKKRLIAIFMVTICCLACFACANKSPKGNYRSIDSTNHNKYHLELSSSGKCKVYYLREGESKNTLVEYSSLFNGKYTYSYSTDASTGKQTGKITITVDNRGEDESIDGKILSDGRISIEVWGKVRTFTKQ